MPLKKLNLLAGAAAIVSIGALTSLLYLKTMGVRAYSLAESAKLVPDEAMMATFISPTPEAIAHLKQFGTPETRTWITQSLTTFKQQSLAGTSLNFERDLQPWMGGVMVALLPAQEGQEIEDFNLLMVVGIKNPIKAWHFSRKFNATTNIKRQQREYRGVEIIEYTEPGGKRYNVALLNSHLVVAADPTAIERAIETTKGEPALASLTGTEQTFLNSVDVPYPIATLYIAEYPTLIEQITQDFSSSSPLSMQVLSQLKPIESVVLGIGVDQDGIRLKATTQLNDRTLQPSDQPQLDSLVTRFPADTIGLIQTQGIQQVWSEIVTLAEENSDLNRWVIQIRRGLNAINLDADQDVFGWMDGEFALGLIASEEGVLAALGLGGVLLLETSDRPAAEKMLTQLDTVVARSNPPVNVEQRAIGEIQVTEWKDPRQGTLFGHGWLRSNLVFIAFGGPVVEAIASEPQKPLPTNPRFQTVTQSLPQPNHSYVYLDIEKLVTWATGYLIAAPAIAVQPNAIAVLNSVQGLGISATRLDQETARVEMILTLKPKRN
ncbi:MAG: DUF3352 domain-containing protein [Limnoraphis robusta]|uniref:DUF3352 domain-containing protein n=1 Tax=Limnoraphis robusta TaxID=1118279 RepID=UPI002B1FBA93|nr:DUF3352 domain-containing protein [Limnoraphis robusta]MEA5543050.1 DUF3352 domain-containing protein [Limnoraphis robusta Tam1]